MEPKSESLADKTLDEKATQKPEPKLEAASLLGKIFTLMRKKREQDIKYSEQEQLQQSQAQLKELEMRNKILESIIESKDDDKVEEEKPGKKPKPKKEKDKKDKKRFRYPDGLAGFLVDATILGGLILKFNKDAEQTQKEVGDIDKKLSKFDLDVFTSERKDIDVGDVPKTETPKVPAAPEPVKPAPEPVKPAPPATPVKPAPVPEPVKPAPEPVKPAPEPVKPAPVPEPVKPAPEPVKPAPEPVKPAPPATPVKPAPEPVKPTAKPIEQPPKPPPTATKQPEPPVPPATAQKEPKTLSQSIAQKISRGESRGDSKDSYTQANIVKGTNSNEANIVKGNIDVTTGKPFEKSLNEMTIGEVLVLARRRYNYYSIPNPKKPGETKGRGGSAMGKYQFVPDTLREQAQKLYGKGYETKLFDDLGQENLQASLMASNSERLKNAGVKASDASLYMMHFFGNPTQAALVLNGDENASMLDVLDFWYNRKEQKAQPSVENPNIAKMTIGQYKKWLRNKGFDFQDIDITKLNEPIKSPGAGAAIDATSTQNSAAKADAKATQSSVTNNITTQSQQNKKSSPQNKKEDDRPAYQKKVNQ